MLDAEAQQAQSLENRGIRKRGWSERTVWDSRRAQWIKATVLVLPVRHPDFPAQALSLVVCRSKGRTPWYEASQ